MSDSNMLYCPESSCTSAACDSQLSGWSGAADGTAAASAGVGEQEPTVAPADDLLCLLRRIDSEPPLAGGRPDRAMYVAVT
jgi:hypothetical protein